MLHPVLHQLPVETSAGTLGTDCAALLNTISGLFKHTGGVHRRSLRYSQANNGFFSSVAEPRNLMGKREIIPVKLQDILGGFGETK